ncbi:MAG: hypothetical protein FJW94_00675 [Actinobacteria bacterium]|nr:hypothetical protein [Actinomycetota bacterium]
MTIGATASVVMLLVLAAGALALGGPAQQVDVGPADGPDGPVPTTAPGIPSTTVPTTLTSLPPPPPPPEDPTSRPVARFPTMRPGAATTTGAGVVAVMSASHLLRVGPPERRRSAARAAARDRPMAPTTVAGVAAATTVPSTTVPPTTVPPTTVPPTTVPPTTGATTTERLVTGRLRGWCGARVGEKACVHSSGWRPSLLRWPPSVRAGADLHRSGPRVNHRSR